MNLAAIPTPTDLAELEVARRDFPGYRIEVEPRPGRCSFVARRCQPGPGPHTLITSDLTELRAELGSSKRSANSNEGR